jgi:transposase InsO family protein
VNRYRFIAVEKAQFSVAQLCRVLEVAPSGYYAWRHRQPSRRAQNNAALTEQIRALHARSRYTYGAPRIHADLQERKQRVSRKRVARQMRRAGLVGRPPRRFRRTTDPDEQAQTEDLVQRQFRASAPDQKWFGDITYVRTWEGWLYLAVILDAYSRKVVGWAMADHLRTELATAALDMALSTRRPKPGLIQHTDRGVQYTSSAYGELLSAHQARPECRPARHMLGQRCRRELLRHPQDRTDLPPRLAHSSPGRTGDLRVHRRLVQPAPPPLHTGLLQPRRGRTAHRTSYPRGLTNFSIKTG